MSTLSNVITPLRFMMYNVFKNITNIPIIDEISRDCCCCKLYELLKKRGKCFESSVVEHVGKPVCLPIQRHHFNCNDNL